MTKEEQYPMFHKLFKLKNVKWYLEEDKGKYKWSDFEIYATTTNDSFYPKGTRVRVWMVSRMGDVGVTNNLINPIGYDVRGLDADTDLSNYEFIKK